MLAYVVERKKKLVVYIGALDPLGCVNRQMGPVYSSYCVGKYVSDVPVQTAANSLIVNATGDFNSEVQGSLVSYSHPIGLRASACVIFWFPTNNLKYKVSRYIQVTKAENW